MSNPNSPIPAPVQDLVTKFMMEMDIASNGRQYVLVLVADKQTLAQGIEGGEIPAGVVMTLGYGLTPNRIRDFANICTIGMIGGGPDDWGVDLTEKGKPN